MTGARLAQWEPCCVSALSASCCVCLWLKRAIACQAWHPVLHHHTADCYKASTHIHTIILRAVEPVQTSSSYSTFTSSHPPTTPCCLLSLTQPIEPPEARTPVSCSLPECQKRVPHYPCDRAISCTAKVPTPNPQLTLEQVSVAERGRERTVQRVG